ncbi:hypothetical protein OS493_036296 [Desmophyllum pertusum]|uniref:Uncharacterized protein n=1 Tax=Desmophyllum pertusum TaxID=174260 RepID=A0A9X0CU65_9CNID|nr:hypothetical protein OS493_036296 [Desmophyllum pertusum]
MRGTDIFPTADDSVSFVSNHLRNVPGYWQSETAKQGLPHIIAEDITTSTFPVPRPVKTRQHAISPS